MDKGIKCVGLLSLQSCPILCDPMDYSLPGSSVHGILWVRILEWVAMTFSSRSSQPSDRTHVCYASSLGRWVLYHENHLGSPKERSICFILKTFWKDTSPPLSGYCLSFLFSCQEWRGSWIFPSISRCSRVTTGIQGPALVAAGKASYHACC